GIDVVEIGRLNGYAIYTVERLHASVTNEIAQPFWSAGNGGEIGSAANFVNCQTFAVNWHPEAQEKADDQHNSQRPAQNHRPWHPQSHLVTFNPGIALSSSFPPLSDTRVPRSDSSRRFGRRFRSEMQSSETSVASRLSVSSFHRDERGSMPASEISVHAR